MAGHSKWHNIRIRKGKQDAARGKTFTRLAREIIMAARTGGGDPDLNNSLRLAIQKARAENMPADTIKRNIQRGTGEEQGIVYESVFYEGFGPAGIAIILQCLTENRNRTVADIRHIFSKCGGNMSESGSVSWQFKPQGLIRVDDVPEEKLMEVAMEAGAEDITNEEGTWEVLTAPDDLHKVVQALETAGIQIADAELTMIPSNTVAVSEKDAPAVFRIMDMLDDCDDVQQTFSNFDIPDEIMKSLE